MLYRLSKKGIKCEMGHPLRNWLQWERSLILWILRPYRTVSYMFSFISVVWVLETISSPFPCLPSFWVLAKPSASSNLTYRQFECFTLWSNGHCLFLYHSAATWIMEDALMQRAEVWEGHGFRVTPWGLKKVPLSLKEAFLSLQSTAHTACFPGLLESK